MTKRPLSKQLIEEALGKSGFADYAHNAFLALRRVPRQRVIRAVSRLDFVIDVTKLSGADEKEDRIVDAWWKSRARKPHAIAPATGSFARNLKTLGALLGLEPLDSSILRVAFEVSNDPMLEELYNALHDLGFSRQRGAIAAMLGMRVQTINESLRVGSRLERFGLIEPAANRSVFIEQIGLVWLLLGIGGLIFRTVHLFFLRNVQTGLVWMTKILTDPFHDLMLYRTAPLHLLRGELIDPMHHTHTPSV